MPTLDSYLTDTLMRDLVGHDRRPVSFLVYLWLSAEQQRREEAVQISYQELAECIGVSKSSAQSAVGWVVRRRLLAATKQNATATPRYEVLRAWTDRSRRRAKHYRNARRTATDADSRSKKFRERIPIPRLPSFVEASVVALRKTGVIQNHHRSTVL